MFQIFGSLKQFIKPQSCIIDNFVFRLHYKATALILTAFSLLVTAHQYFADPINCITREEIPAKFLDTYCWLHTTFSVEDAWKKAVDRGEVVYPGVAPKHSTSDQVVYHTYYQWVGFVLLLQAVLFYVPHYAWKRVEGGLVRNLVMGLNRPILDTDDRLHTIQLVADYLARNMSMHKRHFASHIVAEIVNFINVCGQMALIDHFLGGEFFAYGRQVLSFSGWDGSMRYNPMLQMFPRLAKCTFHLYGPSGDVERHDALCILPMNIFNEKLYLFLWFWCYFLGGISALALLFRLATVFFRPVRLMVTHSHSRFASQEALGEVCAAGNVGDWFLLDLLSKNMDPVNFRDLVVQLKMALKTAGQSIDSKDMVQVLSHKPIQLESKHSDV